MEDVQQLLNKYKLRVKHWEHDFKKKHNRKPSKVRNIQVFAIREISENVPVIDPVFLLSSV